MPRISDERRAELEAELAAADEDDDSDEVTIGRADGTSFTGSFKRALQLGYVSLPAPKAAKKDEAAGRNVSVFGQRKTS
jgi:hypothetical protein